jgi:signal transduction histidine kinase
MEMVNTSLSPRATRAHALKNCLAVVHAVNRLLESELSEASRERLSRSEKAVQRMLAIIREDLTDGRCADPAGSRFLSAEDVLREVIARVEDRAQAGRVELVAQAGTGGVVGDGPELTEAFANVTLNAIEATPAGGMVVMTTQELPDGSQVWAVRDGGPGIPAHIAERLGTPFLSSRKAGGSGVGLALVRHAIERHGGQIHFRVLDGSGTVVSMRLPGAALDAIAVSERRSASGF